MCKFLDIHFHLNTKIEVMRNETEYVHFAYYDIIIFNVLIGEEIYRPPNPGIKPGASKMVNTM